MRKGANAATWFTRVAAPAFIALAWSLGSYSLAPPAFAAVSDPLASLCEYGITLALSGQDAAAESAFVSLLSREPRDARALNNLGNIHLWRGDADVALAFYAEAAQEDTSDAGIVLNEAVALTVAGDAETARLRADEGVSRAGGPDQAARLLGLHYEELQNDEDSARGADRMQLTRAEAVALLQLATRAVPPDSTLSKAGKIEGRGGKKPIPSWRTAGTRASDSAAATIVYWKY